MYKFGQNFYTSIGKYWTFIFFGEGVDLRLKINKGGTSGTGETSGTGGTSRTGETSRIGGTSETSGTGETSRTGGTSETNRTGGNVKFFINR